MAAVAVERLRDAAATAAPGSFEAQTLSVEVARTEQMMRAIAADALIERPELRSHLLAVSVREPLQVAGELVEFAGAVADVYRRWRRQLRVPS